MDRKQALEVLARDFSAGSIECDADEYMMLTEMMTPLMILLTV